MVIVFYVYPSFYGVFVYFEYTNFPNMSYTKIMFVDMFLPFFMDIISYKMFLKLDGDCTFC